MPGRVRSSEGSIAGANANARTSVKINALILVEAHCQHWNHRDGREQRRNALDEGEAVAYACPGAAAERHKVAPHAREARDRRWGVLPTFRPITFGSVHSSTKRMPWCVLKLVRIFAPDCFRAM